MSILTPPTTSSGDCLLPSEPQARYLSLHTAFSQQPVSGPIGGGMRWMRVCSAVQRESVSPFHRHSTCNSPVLHHFFLSIRDVTLHSVNLRVSFIVGRVTSLLYLVPCSLSSLFNKCFCSLFYHFTILLFYYSIFRINTRYYLCVIPLFITYFLSISLLLICYSGGHPTRTSHLFHYNAVRI